MTFEITRDESEKIQRWEAEHECKFRTNEHGIENEIYVGPTGGNLTFMYTPTGLGTVFKVRCACGAEIDLTDYESW